MLSGSYSKLQVVDFTCPARDICKLINNLIKKPFRGNLSMPEIPLYQI